MLKAIIYQYWWFRRLLCRLGIHSFREESDYIWGDYTVTLAVRGISGYAYQAKKGLPTGGQWRFRECKYCKWGEFKRPVRDIKEENQQFEDFSKSFGGK